MGATAVEIGDARRVTRSRSAETVFLVQDTSDETDALDAVLSAAPASIDGMPLKDVGPLEPIGDPTETLRWRCGVQYAPLAGALRAVGSVTISGEIAAQKQQVFQSLVHLGDYPTGACDYKGLLNVTDDAVEGAEVDVWGIQFEVIKVFAADELPDLAVILYLSGTGGRTPVNAGPFSVTDSETGLSLSFAAGELRLLGLRFGRARGDGAVEFAYSFLAALNRSEVEIPNIGSVGDLKGHEYVWTRNRDQWDEDAHITVKRPVTAHTEQMYPEADFSVLGLGVEGP
jgi:hypothetical protein